MIAIILDERIEELRNYMGIDFCSELSVLSGNLIESQIKELSSMGVTEFIVFKNIQTNDEDKENVIYISEASRIKEKINLYSDEQIVLTFSNIYFEISEKISNSGILGLTDVSLTDDSGVFSCCILNKNDVINVFEGFLNYDDIKKYMCSMKLTEVKLADFVFKINSMFDYKTFLTSVLERKTNIALPEIAEGIFTTQNIPKGDFVIVPPVFFGDDVQVESECVIGPGTIILNKSLISQKSYIKSSVLLNDSFISSGCYLDNVLCCENVSVRRNSAIFSGSVIGRNSIISEDTFVDNGSYIRPYTRIQETKNIQINSKKNESAAGFYGYMPEKAALLGGAIGTVCKKSKIAILCNGEINANILKYALISGLLSTGVECFDFGYGFQTSLLYYINYCNLDYGVFIDGAEDGTLISFANKKGMGMPKDIFYAVKHRMTGEHIDRCKKKYCKNIRQIRGMKSIYIQNLVNNIKADIPFFPVFKCDNKQILLVAEKALSKTKINNFEKQMIFQINDKGTTVECFYLNEHFNKKKLCEFVSFYNKNESVYNCDIWRFDAVYLCFKVIETVVNNNLDFYTEIKNIPSFYIAERIIETDKKLPFIAAKLSEKFDVSFKNDSIVFNNGDVKLKIFDDGNDRKIKLVIRNFMAESAEEFATDIELFLRNTIK